MKKRQKVKEFKVSVKVRNVSFAIFSFTENYSPRSLSALAADKSLRLTSSLPIGDSTVTSTPKLVKKLDSSEFDPDVSVNISELIKLLQEFLTIFIWPF